MADIQKAENAFEQVIVTRDFNGEEIDVVYRKQPLTASYTTRYYAPFEPGTSLVEGDIIYERDVAVPMRDGRIIYCDVYRPNNMTNIPLIIAWSPYGKRHWYGIKETPGMMQELGVPRGTASKYSVFEGPEPTIWCRRGYAVANVDNAGAGYSEGDNNMWTKANGEDGYDFIEFMAKKKWCSGKVGMSGNSALAMAQWYIAAENPPSLAAIAPWEGTSDLYRSWVAHGGIPHVDFVSLICRGQRGLGLTEDMAEMIKKYPLMNGYWEDKIVRAEKIKCPVYVTAGYTHPYHLRDSIINFTKIKGRNKWMRMHRDFEWPDLHYPPSIEDLCRFFDRYLKGIHNGWEMTPRVRVEVTDAYEYDFVTNRPEENWPIPRTQYTKFYLDAKDRSICKELPENEAKTSYDPNNEEALFEYTFTEETEITGHSVLRLWIGIDKGNEADVFVQVRKLGADGEYIPTLVFGERDPGFVGKLRASHRELDPKKSKEHLPVHTHKKEEPLTPGEVYPLDIEIWPNSRIWHAGEKLQISVTGKHIRDDTWFMPLKYDTRNEGNHIIHTGGKYASYFLAPVIPPKHRSGSYVYRG